MDLIAVIQDSSLDEDPVKQEMTDHLMQITEVTDTLLIVNRNQSCHLESESQTTARVND